MLIPIRRFYKEKDIEAKELMMINTRYIISITTTNELPRTRITVDEGGNEPKIIYTNYDIPYIRGLMTKSHNTDQENAP